jgi:hypothetical protein
MQKPEMTTIRLTVMTVAQAQRRRDKKVEAPAPVAAAHGTEVHASDPGEVARTSVLVSHGTRLVLTSASARGSGSRLSPMSPRAGCPSPGG